MLRLVVNLCRSAWRGRSPFSMYVCSPRSHGEHTQDYGSPFYICTYNKKHRALELIPFCMFNISGICWLANLDDRLPVISGCTCMDLRISEPGKQPLLAQLDPVQFGSVQFSSRFASQALLGLLGVFPSAEIHICICRRILTRHLPGTYSLHPPLRYLHTCHAGT